MKYKIKKSNLVILAFITIVVLYITTGGELAHILKVIQEVNPFWLLIAIACIMLYWFFSACTLFIMLRAYDDHIKLADIFKLTLSTQFFNGITPFASGGQPFQIYILKKHSNMELSSITSASMHNFIVYQTVLVAMGTIAVLVKYIFNIFPTNPTSLNYLAIAGFTLNIVVISAMIIIAVSPKLTKSILEKIYALIRFTPFTKKLSYIMIKTNHTVEEFHKDILVLMSDKKMYFKVLALNVIKMLSYYAVAYFICLSVGFDTINIIQALVASAYIMLVTSVVPLPGASGGAEAGFLVFFGAFVVGAKATAIMLLWRLTTYYIGLFIGMLTFYLGYRSPSTD